MTLSKRSFFVIILVFSQPVWKMNAAAAAEIGRDQFLAKDFFEDIVGMSEQAFRRAFGWNEQKGEASGTLTQFPFASGNRRPAQKIVSDPEKYERWKLDWIDQYPRRQAIFEGRYYFETLDELDAKIRFASPSMEKGRFTVLQGGVGVASNEIPTEITALQANMWGQDAVFQIASTSYGPLEGATSPLHALLTGMVDYAVQGEWASISTAGAIIYRKYFMPTENYVNHVNKLSSNPNYFDLFELWTAQKQKGLIGIFTHEDVAVTSWFQNMDKEDKGQTVMNAIPLDKGQRVTQIFNAAYDMKFLSHDDPRIIDEARNVVAGMYEGVLKSAYVRGKKRVFLTLLGGGSFQNDIDWIGDAIDNPSVIDFIRQSGLEVYLIYWPDRPGRRYNQGWFPRSAEKDAAFLQRMNKVANKINGSEEVDPRRVERRQSSASARSESVARVSTRPATAQKEFIEEKAEVADTPATNIPVPEPKRWSAMQKAAFMAALAGILYYFYKNPDKLPSRLRNLG